MKKFDITKMNNENKPILITGANGFIGQELCKYLWHKNYAITECSYNLDDIENIQKLFEANKPDIVIHLAAKLDKFKKGREKDDFFQVNVIGTLNIVRLCQKYNVKLIYFSTSSVKYSKTKYGNKYRISKLLAENLIECFTKNQGLKAVTIRPSAIYKTVNGKTLDRFGKEEDVTKGEWYSMSNLFILIESIIAEDDFEKYMVYKTKMLRHYFYNTKALFGRAFKKLCSIFSYNQI